MKYLTLIRHAKAGSIVPGSDDAQRTLSDRGRADARMMGRILAAQGRDPQCILVSPARRAIQTGELLKPPVAMDVRQQLYLAEAETIWDFAYTSFLEYQCLWIIAHNPGISEAVELFSGSRIENVPPGGIITIVFDELIPAGGNGRLIFFDIPAHHR